MQSGDYVMFDVAGKVWAGDRLVIDSFTKQPAPGTAAALRAARLAAPG